jgi:hypothetical protein
MRCGVIVAAALVAMGFTVVLPGGAHAQEYCGYAGRPGAIVQCGYSSLEGCENTIGKGAMCFVNPSVALNTRRQGPFGLTARRSKSEG